MGKTKLVIADLDGCVLPKGLQTPNLKVLATIREQNRASRIYGGIPPITYCTGRPQPYLESIMKLTDCQLPAVFEWGGGLFIPTTYQVLYNDLCTRHVMDARNAILRTIQTQLVPELGVRIQPGKEATITLYAAADSPITLLSARLSEALKDVEAAKQFTFQESRTRIDILPIGLDKGKGVRWLSQIVDIDLCDVLGIGDDESDLAFLNLVGRSACPCNATAEVREIADYASNYENGEAIEDILSWMKSEE